MKKETSDKYFIQFNKIFDDLEKIVKTSAKLSNEEIFDVIGLENKLEGLKIDYRDLKNKHIAVFINGIQKFMKRYPAFRERDITDQDDLEFFRKQEDFDDFLDKFIQFVKNSFYNKYKDKVIPQLEKSQEDKVQIDSIEGIDKVPLMFTLSKLEEKGKIKSYDLETITLK